MLKQAEMILRSSEESVPEPGDRADVRRRYDAVVTGEIERGCPFTTSTTPTDSSASPVRMLARVGGGA